MPAFSISSKILSYQRIGPNVRNEGAMEVD